MRNRTFHTSLNLLLEANLYQELKMIARAEKCCMSQIVRDGIRLRLDQIGKKNKTAIGGDNYGNAN